MRFRVVLPIVALCGAAATALWIHEGWTAETARPFALSGRGNHLRIRVGGQRARLVVPTGDPSAPATGIEAASTRTRAASLRAGESLSEFCVRVLGNAAYVESVLELNGWTAAEGRSLRAGTLVRLP